MRNIKCYCKNCMEEIILDIDNIADIHRCSECGGQLILDENNVCNLIKNDMEQFELEEMKDSINKYGNDKMWDKIERAIDNPYFRLKFRRLFFKCGGTVPEKGMII